MYLSVSNKYTMDYACEMAWREDVRRLSTGKKLKRRPCKFAFTPSSH